MSGTLDRGAALPGAQGGDPQPLEVVVGLVLRAGVTLSSACLAVGVVLSMFGASAAAADILLHVGVIVLLATPVARVVASIVQYVGGRDWPFAALTAIVLLELMASVVAALVFNKRL
ncbi:MAG: DUF1634 domain-containing protein [Acidobacteria bacterium]|nr:DUF1634 domain-containing protein [Acidobacteriota bacterium]